jgi:hypothetical protein
MQQPQQKGEIMRSNCKTLVSIFFAMALTGLGAVQFYGTEALAQSSYFTSRGCVDCHSAPTVATCAGCHQHSGTLTATKNKTTAYAPGETVTITMTASGARSGWIGARLYSQTGAEIARSTGSQSGMGGSTLYPATLSAPAPATAGTYTWRMAYLGNQNGTGTGDVHAEKSVNVSITVAAPGDTTLPVVGAFTIPATATGLTVPVSSLTATDNVGVTGYLVNTSATKPLATAAGWTATAPASVTAPAAGSVTFYAWAKDAAGNVSASRSAVVAITLPDTTLPVVGAFTIPATSTSLTVPVSSLTATDNVGVSGYLVNTSATKPLATAAGWTATAPANVTAPAAGSVTFYAWAKDAAGNVSASRSALVAITLPDTTLPVVGAFTIPASTTSLTVPVSSLTATDNVAVTGYLVTTSATKPLATAAGWTATAPASITAPAAGSVTFYAWAKDAAGNVSASRSAAVSISLPDTAAPVVGTFTLPASATNLTIVVSALSATDNVAVTGYIVTTNATKPLASAIGWTSSTPASVAAPSAGSITFYAWAKDAAGNVSASRSATVTITLPDTVVPVVNTFTIPATATSLTVPVTALSATDNVGVSGYLVNTSATKPLATAAGWTATAPATVTASVEGNVTFYAWAKDASGNVSLSRSASVVITTASETDTTKPALSVSALANGAYTNKPTLNVTGTATDAGGLDTVTVNGQAVLVNGDGSFSTALNLVAGANTVTVVATDKAGNQQSDSRTVNYDANVPELTVADPADNSISVQSFLTVSGTVNETSTVSVKVNGGSAQSASLSGSSFSATVNLISGVNTIEIIATDLAGNQTSAKRTVSYEGGTFTLAVIYPNQDITTSKSSMVLTGKIVDATSRVRVTVNMDGRNYTPRVYAGAFRQRLEFSRSKLYAITVTATDEAGNSSSVVRNVIFKNRDRDDDDDHDDRDDREDDDD